MKSILLRLNDNEYTKLKAIAKEKEWSAHHTAYKAVRIAIQYPAMLDEKLRENKSNELT